MAERLKAAVLKTAKGSQPFVGSNPTSSVASFFEWSQVWRDGREAEGTGLLNLHIRKGIEGSNPSLSVAHATRAISGSSRAGVAEAKRLSGSNRRLSASRRAVLEPKD